jgi:hypothetical protein
LVQRSLREPPRFERRLFGYRRAVVDRQLAGAHASRTDLECEVERLRAALPLMRVPEELATLLNVFATAVSTLADQIATEAEQRHVEAELTAGLRKVEADKLLAEARDRAATAADELVRAARQEIADLAHERMRIAVALEQAALSIDASSRAIAGLPRMVSSNITPTQTRDSP